MLYLARLVTWGRLLTSYLPILCFCGADGIRTHILYLARVALSQLSYNPINETISPDFTDGLFPITCCVATQSRVLNSVP